MRPDAPRTPSPAERPARVAIALMLATLAIAGCARQAARVASVSEALAADMGVDQRVVGLLVAEPCDDASDGMEFILVDTGDPDSSMRVWLSDDAELPDPGPDGFAGREAIIDGVRAESGFEASAMILEPPSMDSVNRTPTSMPEVRRLTPAQAAGRLAGADARVVVVFSGYEATRQIDGTYVAGVRHPDRIERVQVGDSVWPLERIINHSRHLIATQSPPPGTPLSGTATITLTAGPHPDSEPRSWYRTHMEHVTISGAEACFECHTPTACAACHLGEEVVGTGRLITP